MREISRLQLSFGLGEQLNSKLDRYFHERLTQFHFAMSVAEQRSRAKELLDHIDDDFFAAIYQLMETYVSKQKQQVLGYTPSGEAITVGAFLEEAEEQVRRAKSGEGITVDELQKQSAEWLARTK